MSDVDFSCVYKWSSRGVVWWTYVGDHNGHVWNFFPPVEAVSRRRAADEWGYVRGRRPFSFLTNWRRLKQFCYKLLFFKARRISSGNDFQDPTGLRVRSNGHHTVERVVRLHKIGRTSVENESRSGRPSTSSLIGGLPSTRSFYRWEKGSHMRNRVSLHTFTKPRLISLICLPTKKSRSDTFWTHLVYIEKLRWQLQQDWTHLIFITDFASPFIVQCSTIYKSF